jgi:hypothetical protein
MSIVQKHAQAAKKSPQTHTAMASEAPRASLSTQGAA